MCDLDPVLIITALLLVLPLLFSQSSDINVSQLSVVAIVHWCPVVWGQWTVVASYNGQWIFPVMSLTPSSVSYLEDS